MNSKTFSSLLKQFEDSNWQAVMGGKSVLMIDDLHLGIGAVDAASLLNYYYLTYPLTLTSFNQQAQQLIEQYGAGAFAAPAGQLPGSTLFVEGGEVVAETAESPRHCYGVYLELERPLPESAIGAHVQ